MELINTRKHEITSLNFKKRILRNYFLKILHAIQQDRKSEKTEINCNNFFLNRLV